MSKLRGLKRGLFFLSKSNTARGSFFLVDNSPPLPVPQDRRLHSFPQPARCQMFLPQWCFSNLLMKTVLPVPYYFFQTALEKSLNFSLPLILKIKDDHTFLKKFSNFHLALRW